MIAGLSAPPDLAISTAIASQSNPICARASASKAGVASGLAAATSAAPSRRTPALPTRMRQADEIEAACGRHAQRRRAPRPSRRAQARTGPPARRIIQPRLSVGFLLDQRPSPALNSRPCGSCGSGVVPSDAGAFGSLPGEGPGAGQRPRHRHQVFRLHRLVDEPVDRQPAGPVSRSVKRNDEPCASFSAFTEVSISSGMCFRVIVRGGAREEALGRRRHHDVEDGDVHVPRCRDAHRVIAVLGRRHVEPFGFSVIRLMSSRSTSSARAAPSSRPSVRPPSLRIHYSRGEIAGHGALDLVQPLPPLSAVLMMIGEKSHFSIRATPHNRRPP